jgi:hypothetical protein
MRKVSISVLILCLVLGTAVVAMAKDTSQTANGAVTTVDPAAKSFSVKEKTGEETFLVTATTKLEERGKTITLADLKSGEEVTVWYTANAGKNEASKVIVHATKKPAKTSKSGRR